ncbi:hypothetical protein EMIT0P43_10227 [Pseudomonas jessenii]
MIGLDQPVTLHPLQFPANLGSVAGAGDVKLEPPGGKPAANIFFVLSHVLDDPLSQGRGNFFRHDFVLAAIAADFEGGRSYHLVLDILLQCPAIFAKDESYETLSRLLGAPSEVVVQQKLGVVGSSFHGPIYRRRYFDNGSEIR